MTAHLTPVRILVVDDDAMSRDLLALLLEAEGYAVETAVSGDAALTLLSNVQLQVPGIVLADLKMPGISGRALAERLRALCGPQTLLIAMSGSAAPADTTQLYDAFLLKPFTMEQFGQLAQAAVAASPSIPGSAGSLPAELSPQTVLDETIYAKLTQSMKPNQLLQLYTLCMEDARTRILALRRAATDRDKAAFIHQAHAIKGSAGMLGATEIYNLAAALERTALATPHLDLPNVADPDSLLPKSAEKVNPLDELSLACNRLERILLARAIPAVSTG
jgi:CheY-like chemotaxis protein